MEIAFLPSGPRSLLPVIMGDVHLRVTSYLLFAANLVNQMGRVMVPAIKTSVLADAEVGAEFKE